MTQFDVHAHPIKSDRTHAPFVIVLQSDLIDAAETAVIAPLLAMQRRTPQSRLYPVFVVKSKSVIMDTTDLVSVRRKVLGPVVANLEGERRQIIAAIDLLFTGI